MPRDVVVLVDEDIAHDKRVLAALVEYSGAKVIDCASKEVVSRTLSIRTYLNGLKFLIIAALRGVAIWGLLRQQYGLQAKKWISGLDVSFRAFVRAQQVVSRLQTRMNGVRLIHAHDLYCGVIGAELSRLTGAELVYDAHEVEFHRNRKNSWMRTAFDWVVEKQVIARASEVRVVNLPIADLYQRVHEPLADRLRVVPNNHFAIRLPEVAQVPAPETGVIVYVGGGVKGRQLECLAERAAEICLPVHAFFVGEVPEFAKASGWVVSGSDYEDELVSLVVSHRCMMWCCVDDVCLSYRLSLPNKFFQALAVGIPVIAAKGSYLAELVEANGIGAVFDGKNLVEIIQMMKSAQYEEWTAQVREYRETIAVENNAAK
ncbi:MAG: glycosyltransferase [Sterolibacterium sp.]|nr:glycosyltransferase [Sterolibacterium sp.]